MERAFERTSVRPLLTRTEVRTSHEFGPVEPGLPRQSKQRGLCRRRAPRLLLPPSSRPSGHGAGAGLRAGGLAGTCRRAGGICRLPPLRGRRLLGSRAVRKHLLGSRAVREKEPNCGQSQQILPHSGRFQQIPSAERAISANLPTASIPNKRYPLCGESQQILPCCDRSWQAYPRGGWFRHRPLRDGGGSGQGLPPSGREDVGRRHQPEDLHVYPQLLSVAKQRFAKSEEYRQTRAF